MIANQDQADVAGSDDALTISQLVCISRVNIGSEWFDPVFVKRSLISVRTLAAGVLKHIS